MLLWTVALIGLVLPFAGAAAGLAGLWRIWRSEPYGAALLVAGAVAFVLDILVDVWLQRSPAMAGDAAGAALNTRAARHLGDTAVLDRPIVGGRGRIRLGDTFWAISGPDLPAGATVRVVGAKGSVLDVQPVAAAD